jgi:beta-galactosidase
LELTVGVAFPPELLKEENTLVILTESMGHNKGFMEDSFNPRGLVSAQTAQGELDWEFKPGLLPGERGITPKVDFAQFSPGAQIKLPHQQPAECGIGIYVADFALDLAQADQPAVGIKIGKVSGKANIYINGFLIGRYWDAVGPQKIFYLPPDLANLRGGNELAVVVWPWGKELELGGVEIVEYP